MKKQALNPYLPSYEYIPDGEPYVFGDRVYMYMVVMTNLMVQLIAKIIMYVGPQM